MLSGDEIREWYSDWFIEGGVKKFRDEVLEEAAEVAWEGLEGTPYEWIAGNIRALKDIVMTPQDYSIRRVSEP